MAVVLSLTAHAAEKTRVHVTCGNNAENDSTRALFCTSLRDEVALSPRYHDTNIEDSNQWDIRVATVPIPV